MVDNVLKFYKNNLTAYSLVYKHFKWKYRFFIYSWLVIIITFILFWLSVESKFYITQAFFAFLISLVIGAYMFRVFNCNAKKVLYSEHNIQVRGNTWRDESFEIMRAEMLRDYLIQNQLFKEKKIRLLIDLLVKESERRKIPSFVAPGILLAFLVPVWVQYVMVLYKFANDQQSAFALMIIISIFVYVVIYIGGMLRGTYLSIKEILSDNQSAQLNRITILLEDCLLRYSDNLSE